jgi:hypothetical protein
VAVLISTKPVTAGALGFDVPPETEGLAAKDAVWNVNAETIRTNNGNDDNRCMEPETLKLPGEHGDVRRGPFHRHFRNNLAVKTP